MRGIARIALEIIGTVVLVIFYFVVVTVIGGAMRLFGRNPLKHSAGDLGFWQKHRGAADRRAMERQS